MINEEDFKRRFAVGKDYLVKPYALPVVQPDHPGEVPPEPRRVKCYECGYCQFSSLHFDELVEHFDKARSHPFKYGETGVHPELVEVHPALHDRHVSRLQLNGGLPKDVEAYEEVGADAKMAAPVKPVAAVVAAKPVPAQVEVTR
jgi:hypothetical protein